MGCPSEISIDMSLIRNIHLLDQDLTLAINAVHCSWSDHLWQFFSAKEVWFPLYAVIAVMLIGRLGWKRGMVAILSIVATIVACDQFSNLIKDAVERLRPCHDPTMIDRGLRLLEGKANLYGFFSAHAAKSFGFAVASLMAFRMSPQKKNKSTIYGWVIILWATMVSVSRIFVGKHYLGDVIVGAAVGILFGWLFARLARWIVSGIESRPTRRKRS